MKKNFVTASFAFNDVKIDREGRIFCQCIYSIDENFLLKKKIEEQEKDEFIKVKKRGGKFWLYKKVTKKDRKEIENYLSEKWDRSNTYEMEENKYGWITFYREKILLEILPDDDIDEKIKKIIVSVKKISYINQEWWREEIDSSIEEIHQLRVLWEEIPGYVFEQYPINGPFSKEELIILKNLPNEFISFW